MMNPNFVCMFVAIVNNEIVLFDTNLTKFVARFNIYEKQSRNYTWFSRQFKKESHFSVTLSGKEYFFQEIRNPDRS